MQFTRHFHPNFVYPFFSIWLIFTVYILVVMLFWIFIIFELIRTFFLLLFNTHKHMLITEENIIIYLREKLYFYSYICCVCIYIFYFHTSCIFSSLASVYIFTSNHNNNNNNNRWKDLRDLEGWEWVVDFEKNESALLWMYIKLMAWEWV